MMYLYYVAFIRANLQDLIKYKYNIRNKIETFCFFFNVLENITPKVCKTLNNNITNIT